MIRQRYTLRNTLIANRVRVKYPMQLKQLTALLSRDFRNAKMQVIPKENELIG